MSNSRTIFISYAWDDSDSHNESREQIVNEIYDTLVRESPYAVSRDKVNLGYKGNITEYMTKIGNANAAVVVISDKYLHSIYCMFEISALAKNPDFSQRIFPIVLPDANIFSDDGMRGYISHWENQYNELRSQLLELDRPENHPELYRKMQITSDIWGDIDRIMGTITAENTLTPEIHRQENFTSLIAAINDRMQQVQPGRTWNGSYKKYTCDRVDQLGQFETKSRLKEKLNFFYVHGDEEHAHIAMFERFVIALQSELRIFNAQAPKSTSGSTPRVVKQIVRFQTSNSFELYLEKIIVELYKDLKAVPDPNVPITKQNIGQLISKSPVLNNLGPNDCVAIMFPIESLKWKSFTRELIAHFINNFCNPSYLTESSPRFYFFMSIIYMQKAQGNLITRALGATTRQKIKRELKKGNPSEHSDVWADLVAELDIVDRQYVEVWMSENIDFGEDISRRKKYIDEMIGPQNEYVMGELIGKLEKILETKSPAE